MAARVELEGVAALTRQLIALGKLDDGKVLKKAVKSGIEEAYKKAEATIPVGHVAHYVRMKKGGTKLLVAPGFAKQSLRTISTINGAKNVASGILSVRKAAFYIIQFIEFGTSKIPAHPWLLPAFYGSRSAQEEALKDVLEAGVLKAAATK